LGTTLHSHDTPLRIEYAGAFYHVFQGRYKAILVQKNEYLLESSRYVALNPVRASMVKGVDEWL